MGIVCLAQVQNKVAWGFVESRKAVTLRAGLVTFLQLPFLISSVIFWDSQFPAFAQELHRRRQCLSSPLPEALSLLPALIVTWLMFQGDTLSHM